MGNKKSRIIEVDNIQEHLNKCQQLDRRKCPVYGPVHEVRYQDNEFMLGEAHQSAAPSLGSLHYLIPPNLLVVPIFQLLEDSKPNTLDDLSTIIVDVAELCRDYNVGVGRNRIGRAEKSNKWGIVGERNPSWPYQEASQNPNVKGVYLSPQQMHSLQQGKTYPKHNPKKSDVFALGFMVLEIIFQEDLSDLFNYQRFELDLKPILEKLNTVKLHFGESLYMILLKMLELEEEERADFDELLEMLCTVRAASQAPPQQQQQQQQQQGPQSSRRGSVIAGNSQVNNAEYSCRTPTNKSPRHRKSSVVIGEKISPFKVGCFMDNVRTPERLGRTGKTPDRSNISNFNKEKVSPLKRDLRINTRFDKQNKLGNGAGFQQPSKSPLGGRKPTVSPLSRR